MGGRVKKHIGLLFDVMNTFGRTSGAATISKGITRLDIPESGYAIIKGEKRK